MSEIRFLHWMRMIHNLIIIVGEYVNWEEIHSKISPSHQHQEKEEVLNGVLHVNCHLEYGHKYVREVHNQHDDCPHSQEVD